jgi:uncharacterized protein YcaQ
LTITMNGLRAQAVTHSLFKPTTLGKAIARLGMVQADPIRAPACAQDLILRQRVDGYRAGDLERRYPDLQLEEDHIHVYGFLPASTLALLHPRHGEWLVESEYPGLAEQVLERAKASGEVEHRLLEAECGLLRTRGDWGNQAKATSRVLEMLHYRGWLRVYRRQGNKRTFVASSPRECDLTAEERLRQLIVLLAQLYMPLVEATLGELVSRLRYAAPSLRDHRSAVARMLRSGELERTEVGGVGYIWPAGLWSRQAVPRMVRLLAPFDPLVWDRRRFQHLWGWPYRFEAYTPKAKRRWGYYALPMLWGDQVIGWANLSVLDGRLRAELGFVEGRPSGAAFQKALDLELARMASFLNLKEPVIE